MARRDEKREALVILFLLLDKVFLRCQVIELSEPLDELGAQVYRHVLFLVPPLMCRSRLRAMTTISSAMTLRATQNLSRLAAGDKAALSTAAKRACIANTWSDSADSNIGCEGGDVSSDSDNSSAEAVATPPSTDDQILAKMNAGCGCQKNHFAPLSLENYKSLRQQFTGASLQHRDSYLLGVLSAGLRSRKYPIFETTR